MKENWKYKKLGEVCKVINGLWTGKNPPFINVAVIRNTNFSKDCKLNLSDVAYIDVEEKQFKTRKLQYGDIIIEKSGGSDKQSVGRAVYFDKSDGNYSFSNFTSTLRVINSNEINPSFLQKVLFSKYNNGVMFGLQSKTTGLHNLDMKGFLNLPIPVPPLPVQQQIVAELDLLSDIIEKQKQQIAELDKLAQATFYDMFGDPVTNEKGWEVKKLGEVAIEKLSYGSGASAIDYDGKLRYVRITDICDSGELNDDFKSPSSYDERYLLNDGDILFARSGATVGKTYCHNSKNGQCIYAGYLIRMIPDRRLVLPEYIFQYTKSEFYNSFIRKSQNAVAQPNINAKQYSDLTVLLPPLPLQQSFASRIEAIERQKELISNSIKESQKLFDSRMEYWFG